MNGSQFFVRPPTESCRSTRVGPLTLANEGAVAKASEVTCNFYFIFVLFFSKIFAGKQWTQNSNS